MKIVNTFFVAFFAITTNAATIYVNSSAPAGGDGSSWATAFNTIDPALSASSGTDIWVAAGTYPVPCNSPLATNVNIYGGFAGTETQTSQRGFSGSLPTIQSTLTMPPQVDCYLFNLTGTANRFDGLTFSTIGGVIQSGGSVTAVSDTFVPDPSSGGGEAIAGNGIVTYNGGTLVVDKSVFQNLQAGVGAAVSGLNAASITVTNSTFIGNQSGNVTYWNPNTNSTAEVSGGGAINVDGNFYYYYYNYGPPLSNTRVTLSGNTFYRNASVMGTNGGGAIHVGNAGSVSITNSTFGAAGNSNSAWYPGGAISLNANSSIAISGNSFVGNTAYLGGAISSTQENVNATISITSNIFTQNSASYQGGAIADLNEAHSGTKTVALNVTGNTFSQNTSPTGPAIYYDGTEAKIDSKTSTAAIDSALVTNNTNLRRADISP